MASQYETVVRAIESQLKAKVVGGSNGYIYTPDDVQRVMYFPDPWVPDPSLDTLYVLHPGEETIMLGPDTCSIEGQAEMFLVLFRSMSAASENPATDAPERWQIANDLIADAAQAIFSDHTFGGTAICLLESTVFADRARMPELPTHAVAGLRFVVRYRTSRPGR